MSEKLDTANRAVCRQAGRDPDEKLIMFVLADVAAALLDAGHERDEVAEMLRKVRADKLGDDLCAASGWMEILATSCEERYEG